ncbi:MAG: N-acetylmuramoyl-L-alanine amidase [Lachnospiraceae bacterium]|nr:N-acetylmuramoyl-L-alanine amidase [Lachnospiraceae bacterium]
MSGRRKSRTRWVDIIICIFAAIGVVSTIAVSVRGIRALLDVKKVVTEAPQITEELLTVNEYSRPGKSLDEVHGIVVHYTANPGTSAENNRSYFEGLKDSHDTYASSHYIIDIDGEIIQCIPLTEQAYASNDRNYDTIAIECCHPDETGVFSKDTYDELVHLTAWLLGQYDLEIDDVIRHYDVSGKPCPKYFVDHPEKWEEFKSDVEKYIDTHGEKVRKHD